MRQNGSVAQLAIGDVFAGCRVENVLGAGGMGVVYRGTDLVLERPVAIKLIASDRAGDESARRRFEREARLMAAIDHPNVIPVYAAGEQDGDLYLVMRFVDGTDLQRRIQAGALAPREAARIVDQVAKALDAAHGRGLVHRDIKPANVLLSGEHVYLSDFGITRLVDGDTHTTETGDWIGTVDFMSPEHLRGEETDARSDVYSLGCVLYACLTGVAPFRRTTMAATIAAHLGDRPPAPSHTHAGLPGAFDQVIGRALAKKPAHRYASAGELGEAALAAAEGRPTRWGKGLKRTNANTGPSETPTRVAADTPTPRPVAAAREPAAGEPAAREPAAREPAAGEPAGPEPAAGEPAATEPPASELDTVVRGGDALVANALPVGHGEHRAAGHDAGWTKTRVAGADQIPTLQVQADAEERPRRGTFAVGAAAVAVALAAVLTIVLLHSAKPRPLRAFSGAEVNAVMQRFASAYSSRNATALAELLAPDVMRVAPTSVEHGAASVLADYRRQFSTTPRPIAYRLSGMVINGGWVGRASGRYTLRLKGGTTLSGHVIFAIQRIDHRSLIGLIATQQDSG